MSTLKEHHRSNSQSKQRRNTIDPCPYLDNFNFHSCTQGRTGSAINSCRRICRDSKVQMDHRVCTRSNSRVCSCFCSGTGFRSSISFTFAMLDSVGVLLGVLVVSYSDGEKGSRKAYEIARNIARFYH